MQVDLATVQSRLAALSVQGATVVRSGDRCLSIDVGATANAAHIIQAVTATGYLALAGSGTVLLRRGTRVRLVCRRAGCDAGFSVGSPHLHVRPPVLQIVVPMRLMKRGSARAQSDTSGPDVVFSLLSQGSTAWCAFTRHHISRYVAIVLDGAVIIDPVVQQAICEPESQVSGVGSLERAREIAAYINTGPLPVPLSP